MSSIRKELESISEEEYCVFTQKLLPGVEPILGVRLPNLRKLAKRLAKEDWKSYLLSAQNDSFEEILLQGMVIGYVKVNTIEELFPYIREYVSKIDNWSSCDSFCTGLKITKKYPEEVWAFLQPYFHSDQEFDIRFAVVMGLLYFINDQYKEEFQKRLNEIHHEGYYVKMAVAWAVSMIYVKYPQETFAYLQNDPLDDMTHNKAIQKIRESYQVSKEEKELLKSLKRNS
ncbi:MAG: DNA alkylation repair protein [Lachnospiraceae bacterium]|nr:DNA alkylation repair protein [Lachnospiraceae bacterium]